MINQRSVAEIGFPGTVEICFEGMSIHTISVLAVDGDQFKSFRLSGDKLTELAIETIDNL